MSFSEYVNLAILIDKLMRQAPRCRSARGVRQSHVTPVFNVSSPETTVSYEPMQINFSRLSEEETARHRQFRLCFYCGEAGHRSLGCPHKSQTASRVNIEHFALLSNKSFTLPVSLRTENLSVNLTAVINSGAALNLINKDLKQKYNIPDQPCTPPIRIKAIDNTPIGKGITHQTKTLTLTVGLFHQESISLYLIDFPQHDLILGFPWLSAHDPSISWQDGELIHCSDFCMNHCFATSPLPCLTTSVESPETNLKVEIPTCYHDLMEVFSKVKATQLPPHHPWDCAIDLLPNTMPPKRKIYPLSRNESQAMEEYITEALNSGFI